MSDPSKQLAKVKTTKALSMTQALNEQTEMSLVLKQYISKNMEPEIDFGVIPGTKNSTLLQPGAEKIAGLFRCVAKYTCIHRTEEFTSGLFAYEWQCELIDSDTGDIRATGIGAANSYESKWRYRTAMRTCPSCGKPTIIKQKEEKGGNWLCLGNDKGGCWAKFGKDDPAITGQQVGRVENENMADLQNTVAKIGKKRSLVDASASLCRRFGFNYTVDMEDVQANEQAKGGQRQEDETHDADIMCSKDTQERIVCGLASLDKNFGMPNMREWFAKEVLKRPLKESEGVGDLTQAEGDEVLKAVLWLMEEKKKKAPISKETKDDVLAGFRVIGRTWEVARDKGWITTVIRREFARDDNLDNLTQAEGKTLYAELERLASNMKVKT